MIGFSYSNNVDCFKLFLLYLIYFFIFNYHKYEKKESFILKVNPLGLKLRQWLINSKDFKRKGTYNYYQVMFTT